MKFSYYFRSMCLVGFSVFLFASCSNDEFDTNDNQTQSSLRSSESNPLMGKWSQVYTDENGNIGHDNIEFTADRILEQLIGVYENGSFNENEIAYQFNSGYTYVDGASYFLMTSSFGGPDNKIPYTINGNQLILHPNTHYSIIFTRVN